VLGVKNPLWGLGPQSCQAVPSHPFVWNEIANSLLHNSIIATSQTHQESKESTQR
jgi:hypothetical protein